MITAVIALGSNLGDRLGHLQLGVDSLAAVPGIRVLSISDVVETDPVGGPDQPDYANAALIAEVTLEPLELLDACQAAERAADRVRDIRWGPRTLDVDVVALFRDGEELTVDHPRLGVPHPRAHERAFVLVPWAQVQPDATLHGEPITALLNQVGEQGVRPSELALDLP